MKTPFLSDDFLLQTETARRLYHEYAKVMPIIDYHCHLPPELIAADAQFANLTQAWLYGDHYKWRAMRANGVAEEYCTGTASDYEKFERWAETVPYTLRNPLYHWTHLELQRYFGITEVLSPRTARRIYEQASEQLQSPEYSIRNLLRKMKVEVVCTTDDPLDSLQYHRQLAQEGFEIQILPTFRPDKAMAVEDQATFNAYVDALEGVTNVSVGKFDDFLMALRQRHDFFAERGCKLSDHGLEQLYADPYHDYQIKDIFDRIRSGKSLDDDEIRQFKSAMLVHFGEMDWEKGWTQQFHVGALRNNNARQFANLGPDTGWDSIGDFSQGRALSAFLSRLDEPGKLAKTILYNLNPADNELFATMIGNFNDGSVPGKMQFGSGWWFLDQKDGMTRQLNALSNMGLLSRFVGMLTDSRSFLSYPRHEYFRRLLCNLFGTDVEAGELPDEIDWIGQVVQNICYYNAKQYFGFSAVKQSAGGIL